jgi:carbamoyl-phosphate synthase large subunit
VVAADSEPLSVGFVFADAAYQMPRVSSPEYLASLTEICRREHVDWILPALDEELLVMASHRSELEAVGTRLLASSLVCLETCVDKRKTYEFFRRHGIPTPLTWDSTSAPGDHFPVIVKPRRGRGSTGVYIARDARELEFFSTYVQEPIVQEFMTGREMTVDVLADFVSNPLFIRPRYRLETDSGISYKGAVANHALVVSWAEKIIRNIGLIGPANIQCFVDEKDRISFTEINARLAGSVALTFEADPPFAQALATMLNGGCPEGATAPARPLVMLRYWSEVYLDPTEAGSICTRL